MAMICSCGGNLYCKTCRGTGTFEIGQGKDKEDDD